MLIYIILALALFTSWQAIQAYCSMLARWAIIKQEVNATLSWILDILAVVFWVWFYYLSH